MPVETNHQFIGVGSPDECFTLPLELPRKKSEWSLEYWPWCCLSFCQCIPCPNCRGKSVLFYHRVSRSQLCHILVGYSCTGAPQPFQWASISRATVSQVGRNLEAIDVCAHKACTASLQQFAVRTLGLTIISALVSLPMSHHVSHSFHILRSGKVPRRTSMTNSYQCSWWVA